jgi:hypothetical protein
MAMSSRSEGSSNFSRRTSRSRARNCRAPGSISSSRTFSRRILALDTFAGNELVVGMHRAADVSAAAFIARRTKGQTYEVVGLHSVCANVHNSDILRAHRQVRGQHAIQPYRMFSTPTHTRRLPSISDAAFHSRRLSRR